MPIALLTEIWEQCPPETRLLGLDLGDKTIGVAVCDSMQSIATPVQTIRRIKFSKDIKVLAHIIHDYEIGGYVLGWPLHMDGHRGARCDMVQSFADEMVKNIDVIGNDPWIALWDERLSTASMDAFLIESVDMSRTKRKQVIDKLAAQHILQGALDYIRSR